MITTTPSNGLHQPGTPATHIKDNGLGGKRPGADGQNQHKDISIRNERADQGGRYENWKENDLQGVSAVTKSVETSSESVIRAKALGEWPSFWTKGDEAKEVEKPQQFRRLPENRGRPRGKLLWQSLQHRIKGIIKKDGGARRGGVCMNIIRTLKTKTTTIRKPTTKRHAS